MTQPRPVVNIAAPNHLCVSCQIIRFTVYGRGQSKTGFLDNIYLVPGQLSAS